MTEGHCVRRLSHCKWTTTGFFILFIKKTTYFDVGMGIIICNKSSKTTAEYKSAQKINEKLWVTTKFKTFLIFFFFTSFPGNFSQHCLRIRIVCAYLLFRSQMYLSPNCGNTFIVSPTVKMTKVCGPSSTTYIYLHTGMYMSYKR